MKLKTLLCLLVIVFFGCSSEPDEKNGWEFNNSNNSNNTNNTNNSNNVNNTNNTNNSNNVNNTNNANNTNNTTQFPLPDNHRPVAVDCPMDRPPGNVDSPQPERQCSSDADCTEGINGRCHFDRIGAVCSYDECFTDSDCGADGVCGCRNGWNGQNFCMGGDCRIDGDCPDNGFCSPTLDDCGNYFGHQNYFCHTLEDECTNDSDCPDDMGAGPPYCMFDGQETRWVCAYSHCVG